MSGVPSGPCMHSSAPCSPAVPAMQVLDGFLRRHGTQAGGDYLLGARLLSQGPSSLPCRGRVAVLQHSELIRMCGRLEGFERQRRDWGHQSERANAAPYLCPNAIPPPSGGQYSLAETLTVSFVQRAAATLPHYRGIDLWALVREHKLERCARGLGFWAAGIQAGAEDRLRALLP